MSNSDLAELLEHAQVDDKSAPTPKKRRGRVRRAWTTVALIALGLLMVFAAIVLTTLAVAPEETKETVGEIATDVIHAAGESVGVSPRTVLGQAGGQGLVDECPGYWVKITEYNEDPAITSPVYSAHNGCIGYGGRGAVILPLGVGDTIDVQDESGVVQEHVVTDTKDVPQHTSTTADFAELEGSVILQTCYWDQKTMKFVVLEPSSS